jgi:hypothetical protein
MAKLSRTPKPRSQTRGKLYLFPTLDQEEFPLRKLTQREGSGGSSSTQQGDAEMWLTLTRKLTEAVDRLVAAGDWTEAKRSNGKQTQMFAVPTAQVERELQELNDPTLTQALLGATLRVACSRRTRRAPRSRRTK